MNTSNVETPNVEMPNIKMRVIFTSVITCLITLVIVLALLVAWLGPLKLNQQIESIKENKAKVAANDQKIERILSDLNAASKNMEMEIQEYINSNYGELSHRDEKVEKLVLLYEQQEKRLSNIETALAKF